MPEPYLRATGIAPFDLVAPQKRLDPSESRCRVCGKAWSALLRNPFRPAIRDGHEACRAKISEWGRQVDLLAADPEYAAAEATADRAWLAANSLWHRRADSLEGPPDWFKRASRSPLEARDDC